MTPSAAPTRWHVPGGRPSSWKQRAANRASALPLSTLSSSARAARVSARAEEIDVVRVCQWPKPPTRPAGPFTSPFCHTSHFGCPVGAQFPYLWEKPYKAHKSTSSLQNFLLYFPRCGGRVHGTLWPLPLSGLHHGYLRIDKGSLASTFPVCCPFQPPPLT